MQDQIIGWLSCGAVVAVVNGVIELVRYLVRKRDNGRDALADNTAATKFCLLGEIDRYGNFLLERNEPLTSAEYTRFTEMYNLYKKLGGDGYADSIRDRVKGLLKK